MFRILNKDTEVRPMAASLVAKARMTSLKSQEDFAPLLGVSVVTLCKYEKNPDKWMTPERLRVYYDNVGADGKQLLRKYAASFFTS
nr:MAG TPA: Regulatory protein-modification, helix-turn-helix, transcriptional regulator, DNA [Caudoviricetes sp.]